MAFRIMPHGRLQEWVAHEAGYLTAEGLEYEFLPASDYGIRGPGRDDRGEIKTGAFETFGAGRDGTPHVAIEIAALFRVREPSSSDCLQICGGDL